MKKTSKLISIFLSICMLMSVTVFSAAASVSNLSWNSGDPGVLSYDIVPGIDTYYVRLYKDGEQIESNWYFINDEEAALGTVTYELYRYKLADMGNGEYTFDVRTADSDLNINDDAVTSPVFTYTQKPLVTPPQNLMCSGSYLSWECNDTKVNEYYIIWAFDYGDGEYNVMWGEPCYDTWYDIDPGVYEEYYDYLDSWSDSYDKTQGRLFAFVYSVPKHKTRYTMCKSTVQITSGYSNYDVTLPDTSYHPGELYIFNNAEQLITDEGILFALMYNSSHYDEDWVERSPAEILFKNIYTEEEFSFTQETCPLKCIEYGGWWEEDESFFPGEFDIQFITPPSLPRGTYNVTIKLDVPHGKGSDPDVKPIYFHIDKFVVLPNTGGSSGGGSGGSSGGSGGIVIVDRSSVDSAYYDAAKVCYDLDLMKNVYEDYGKIVTKEDLAYALVKLAGLTDAATTAQDTEFFDDLESGTYLNGCAVTLYNEGLLSGDSYGTFGADTEMQYVQILKPLMDLLGYAPYAQDKGGYPYGYMSTSAAVGLTSGVSAGTTATITCQQLAQLMYNALETGLMKITKYTVNGPVYEITDDTLLYELGYDKYQGDFSARTTSTLVMSGKLFNSDNPTGTEVPDVTLAIKDHDIRTYTDSGIKVYAKDGNMLCALKYYYANATLNYGVSTTNSNEIDITFDTVGYAKYSIDGGSYEYIPDSKSITYTLSDGCGRKAVSITLANEDETEVKTFTKYITLKKYHTLRYISEGAVFHTKSVPCGETIPPLTNEPYKYGHVFEGWNGLSSTMPDHDLDVIAVFVPEATVFEATLPSQTAAPGETVVIENIRDLIPENMQFGLNYASTAYEEYIESDAVFTYITSSSSYSYSQSEVALKCIDYYTYNLEIPVPEDLPADTYILTIELPIATAKDAGDVKPYKFTIDEFVVENTVTQYLYKFVDADGTVIMSQLADYGDVIVAPDAPITADPYEFSHWEGYKKGMTVTGDMTFTAVYTYKTYYIWINGMTTSFYATYGDDFKITPPEPTSEEYGFAGYFTEANGKGTQITDENGKSIVPYNFKENITVYPYITHELLNKIKINGTDSTVIGATDVVKKVYFATDKEAGFLLCTIKYPEIISLKEIIAKDFEYVSEESKEIKDGYVYQNLICQYSGNMDNIPVNTKIAPFELVFDIPATVTPQTATIEVTADSILIGEEDYPFDYIINGNLEIAAKPVECIEIIGADSIVLDDGAVTYTAVVTPEYATNKEVNWSVDDDTVATVSDDGVLTPLKKGTVTLIATATDGSKVYAEKTITVTEYAKINSLKSNTGTWDKEFSPEVREYVIYVEEGTEKITLTPSFTSGTLRINGSLAINNRGKSITLSGEENEVILVRSNAAGYTDVNYTITVVKFKGTKTEVSDNGKEFNVKPVNVETGHTVILALYSGDKFIGMQTAIYNGKDISFTTDKEYTSVKVMVWGDLSDPTPSCEAETID